MSNPTFLITHWCGIPPTHLYRADGSLAKERFEQMKDAGINLIAPYDHGVETNRAILSLCFELGLRVLITDHRLYAAQADPPHRQALLRAVVNDYSSYPALFGYYLSDEPHKNDFPALAQTVANLRQMDPLHESYINLFANYVPDQLHGCVDYAHYLNDFVNEVKPNILSYDHYHFLTDEPKPEADIPDERERLIFEAAYSKENRPGFFDNIEQVRATAQKADIPFMVVVLLTAHASCRDLTEGEIRFEVYQSLAYGAARLSYFTYWTPGKDWDARDIWHWSAGIVDSNGDPTHHYDMVARINRKLQAMGNVLAGKRSLGVFHVGRCPDTLTTVWQAPFGGITAIDARDLTVGFFEGGYALLASKDYTAPIALSFSTESAMTVQQYETTSGEWRPLSPLDGCYRITLEAGDGQLIRIQ